MASALQRLRSNVKEQETFEEKVKRNPAEALRELYSSEEYKKYKEMKRAWNADFMPLDPPGVSLSDEFKAKEEMARAELRKIRAEERRELYNSEEYRKYKKYENENSFGFKDSFGSANNAIANNAFNEFAKMERQYYKKWFQIYQYIYGLSDYNPLEDRKVDRKVELDGNPADILRQLYSSEEYKRYIEDKDGNYKISDEFKEKRKIAFEALYDIKKKEWEKIEELRKQSEEAEKEYFKKHGIAGFFSAIGPFKEKNEDWKKVEELKKKVEEAEIRFVEKWGALGYLGEKIGFLNDIGGKVRDYIEGRSNENPLKDYNIAVKEVNGSNPEEQKEQEPIVATINNTQEEQKEQKQELTQQKPQAEEKVEKVEEENKKYKAIATRKGVVSDVGNDYVKIRYNEKGKIYEEKFKGLKDINVKKGDRVKEGQVIGQSDNEINVEKKVVASAGHHHKHHHHKHHHHHNHHHNNHKAGHNENQKSEKNDNANKVSEADIIKPFGQIKLERNQNILINKPEEPKVAMCVAPSAPGM